MFIARFESCKIFVLALGVFGLISSPALATDWRSPGSQREAVEGSRSGSSGSGGGFYQSGPSAADLARQQRLQEAFESNHKGVEFSKVEDWRNAIIWYQSALAKDPDNKIMQQNLAQAQTRLASDKGLDFYRNGDYANAVASFQEAVNKNPFEKNAAIYADNLAAAKSALQAVTDNKAAASSMQQSIQDFAQTLNAAPVSGGLDFDGSLSTSTSQGKSDGLDFTADIAAPNHAKTLAPGDTSVVDARVPRDGAYLTNQVPELKNSPAADRITKGFQAVTNHDWPVALAWWRDALNRDPGNPALKRSVDLAQWMVDRSKTSSVAESAAPLRAAIASASNGDNAEAIRQFKLVKAVKPALAPQVDNMINELRQSQEKDANAEYWNQVINNDMREDYHMMHERGMNMLSIGDEEGAREAFRAAEWYSGMFSDTQPAPRSPLLKPVTDK